MRILSEHVALVASISGLLFITVRLTVISAGSWETASAVLQLQGSGFVLIAALMTGVSGIPIFAVNAWMAWSSYEGRKYGLIDAIAYMTMIVLVLMITPWLIGIIVVATWTLTIAVVPLIRRWPRWMTKLRLIRSKVSTRIRELPRPQRPRLWPTWADRFWPPAGPTLGGSQTTDPDLTDDAEVSEGAAPPTQTPEEAQPSTQESNQAAALPLEGDLGPVYDVLEELKDIARDIDSEAPKRWRRVPDRLAAASSRVDRLNSPEMSNARDAFREVIQQLKEKGQSQNVIATRVLKLQQATLLLIAGVTILVVLALSPVWLPLEKVEANGQTYVGYVLDESDSEIVLLQDRPRGVTRIEGKSERSYCATHREQADSRFIRWLNDPSPAITFLDSPRFQYPECPTP